MRKFIFLLLTITLIFGFSTVAEAKDIQVIINDQAQEFTPSPIIKDGATMVPMRGFFEALGCDVEWDGKTNTAIGRRDGIEVKLPIGSKVAQVNGENKNLSIGAQLINNSTFIPLRFVGEALGDDIAWNSANRTIAIKSGSTQNNPVLRVHFIDVGQGDSELIQFPNGKTMLIDGGTGEAYGRVAAVLAKEKVGKIDVVIGTHPHNDHIGSLPGIIKNYDIGTVYLNGIDDDSRTYSALIREANNKGLVVNQLLQGDTLSIDPEVDFKVLAPSAINAESSNDNSPIVKVTYKNKSFLFTGDAEKDTENVALAYYKASLKSDVVKVGHHGSTTSSTPAFAKAVSPALAIIEVDADNSYGHPDEIVVNRWQLLGAKVYTTAVHGNITVTTNGNSLEIFSNKSTNPLDKALNANNQKEGTNVEPSNRGQVSQIEAKYIANKNTKVFHLSNCSSVGRMSEKNKLLMQTRDEAIDGGYKPCQICEP